MAAKKATKKADPAKKRLTPKEAKFCARYVIHWNGSKAVREAGFNSKAPQEYAHELLTKPHIQSRIQVFRDQIEKLHVDSYNKATAFLERQLHADTREFHDEKGNLKALHQISDEEESLIVGLESEVKTDKDSGVTTLVRKVKLSDRRGAAEALRKSGDRWLERAQRRMPGPETIQPLSEPDEVDVVVISRRIAFALAMGAHKQKAEKKP